MIPATNRVPVHRLCVALSILIVLGCGKSADQKAAEAQAAKATQARAQAAAQAALDADNKKFAEIALGKRVTPPPPESVSIPPASSTGQGSALPGANQEALRLAEEKKTLEEKQRAYLALLVERMKDPDSVQTRNLRFVNGKGGEALCGEVNAKNSFGGYVGFRQFVVTTEIIEKESSRVFVSNPVPIEDSRWGREVLNEAAIRAAGCG